MTRHIYRIEHWLHGERAVVGTSDDPVARIGALEPVAHGLLDRNVGGELLLIEEASGAVVARRPVWLPGDEQPIWWATGDDASGSAATDPGGNA